MSVAPRASLLCAAAIALVGLAGCASASPSAVPTGGSPAASIPGGGVQTVKIEMTDAGCPPVPATATAGPITFQITNKDAGKASEAELVQGERVLAEKENLTPGLSGSFSLEVAPGDYEIYCPGATIERSPFTVTPASP
jgi:iron uptake system component EfeO